MSDTITLWFAPAAGSPPGASVPSAEVHVNLWRHVGSKTGHEDVLDVGLLIREADQLGTLSIYLPFLVDDIPEDLMERLRTKPTLLRAVFNEVVELGPSAEFTDSTFTVRKNESHYLTCHGGLDGTRLELHSVSDDDRNYGTTLTFSDAFCRGMRKPGGHYLRFRIGLSPKASRAFSFKQTGSGGPLSLTWKQREYTEIRFNEMRSVPLPLRLDLRRSDHMAMPISAMHGFLVRDMSFELLAAHSDPHKMRRLESDLWSGYAPASFESDLSRFVVYHWKKEYEVPAVAQSVVLFAKFAHEPVQPFIYLFGIVLLGAMGSALQALTVACWGFSAASSLGLLVVASVVFYIVSLAWVGRRRITRLLTSRRIRKS